MSKSRSYSDIVSQAENAVAAVTDPELKRIAFGRVLDDARAPPPGDVLDSATKLIQVLSVVVGVIISVLSFNAARQTEAEARKVEASAKKAELDKYREQQAIDAEKRRTEAAKPFLELRQKLYLEAVQAAGVLATLKDPSDEKEKARTKFRQLYVAELSLVEAADVARKMKALAEAVDPQLTNMNDEQLAAYHLSHALRDSLVKSWKLDDSLVDNPSQ